MGPEITLGGFTGLPSPEQVAEVKAYDNNKQAVDIKGYRVLSEDEKAAMNYLKELEKDLLFRLSALSSREGINQRSLAIAKTEIQTGFMWAIRSIARPNGE